MSYGKVDPKIDGAVRSPAGELAELRRQVDVLVTGIGNTLIELVELKRRVDAIERERTGSTPTPSG